MRNGAIASLLVIAILAGAGTGYLLGYASERTVTSVSTFVSTSTSTVTVQGTGLTVQTTTITSTSTYTTTQVSTTTSLVRSSSGPLVILGASISHSLPQKAVVFSYSMELNSSSFVAIENNGTGAVTFTQLLLILKYDNGVYTETLNSPPYSLEPRVPLYLELSSLPTVAYLGEPFTVTVTIDHNSTQPFTSIFY